MDLLEEVKQKIATLSGCSAAYILAHAAWSACDFRKYPGPCAMEVSSRLDSGNRELVNRLYNITCEPDYTNDDQAEMLRWIHEKKYSSYVSKQLKTTIKSLIDWHN